MTIGNNQPFISTAFSHRGWLLGYLVGLFVVCLFVCFFAKTNRVEVDKKPSVAQSENEFWNAEKFVDLKMNILLPF